MASPKSGDRDFRNSPNGSGGVGETFRQVPFIGEIAKGFGAESAEERRTREEFARMKEELDAYRKPAADARMQGLSQQLAMFGPVNQQISKMYGPSSMFDTSALMQNPLANLPGIAPGPPTKSDELRSRAERSGWINPRDEETLRKNARRAGKNRSTYHVDADEEWT